MPCGRAPSAATAATGYWQSARRAGASERLFCQRQTAGRIRAVPEREHREQRQQDKQRVQVTKLRMHGRGDQQRAKHEKHKQIRQQGRPPAIYDRHAEQRHGEPCGRANGENQCKYGKITRSRKILVQ